MSGKNFMNIGKEEDWKCRPECTGTLFWNTSIYPQTDTVAEPRR